MKIKQFVLTFILIYLLMSLPGIFSIGYVIDWVPEATLFQKVKGYLSTGLAGNIFMKAIVSTLAGVAVMEGLISKKMFKGKGKTIFLLLAAGVTTLFFLMIVVIAAFWALT